STDKVDTEVPSPVAGVVEKILVEEDETVEVDTELAVIGDGSGGGPAEEAPQEEAAETSPAASEAPASEEVEVAQPEAEDAQEPASAHDQATDSAPSGSTGGAGGQAVTMPALGESVTEGTVTRWLKA
ncbi:2-oxoglutarate dehydrogenase, E2 component, dihydrolipoamide succinyltransferase, partial [Georgenia sp. 10Sc9-8]|nr:2-oxoglutarate dehydrogenase, E2 component, dihydrolipoamide succinyltransferase [Georgenia halotolerans]